jgi:hypothetical protein
MMPTFISQRDFMTKSILHGIFALRVISLKLDNTLFLRRLAMRPKV